MAQPISIIGAGNLGAAQAVFLRKQGHPVCLAGTPEHLGIIPQVDANGNRLTEIDGTRGLGREVEGVTIQVSTGNIARAVQANVIMVTVPVSAQEDVVNALSSHDLSGRTLIFMPCGVAAGLVRAAMAEDRMPDLIVGTVSSPFASRVRVGAKVAITRTKNQLEIAASKPMTIASENYLRSLFPQQLVWYQDIASIFFSNVNPVIHPPTMIVSRHLIQAPGPNPLFYEECMPEAEQCILSVDKERCMLAKALGLQTDTLYGFFRAWYTPEASSYLDSVSSTPSYKWRRAPSFNHRYITEDVKFLLVLMCGVAEKAGIQTPNFHWIVNEASTALGEDLWQSGKTLDSFNMEKASARQIIAWLNGEYDSTKSNH